MNNRQCIPTLSTGLHLLMKIMHIKRDFQYYHNLNNLVTHALLHLLCHVSDSSRFVPLKTRNDILVRYLKKQLNDKAMSHIKKDIKLMLNIARKQGGNLEMKLYELNQTATKNKIEGAEKLYHLLVHLYDNEGIESRLVEEKMEAEYGVLYMLEEHITYGFEHDKQVAPLSLLIRHERAPELINSINQHGGFIAEMFEWNQKTHEAHLQLHPSN